MKLPTEEEIRAAAERDGLVAAGAVLPSAVRKRVAASLLTEAQQAAQAAARPPVTTNTLLSRYRHEVPGGAIVIDVVFIPNQKE